MTRYGQNLYNLQEADLREKYLNQKKSLKNIATEYGCGETLIHKYVHRLGIPIRPRSISLKGRIRTMEHCNNLSLRRKGKLVGDKNPNWRGGVDKANYLSRRDAAFITWRRRVLRIKGATCGNCGKNLDDRCPCCNRKFDKHVHHIQEYADNQELRMSIDNAVVLCNLCHLNQHKK